MVAPAGTAARSRTDPGGVTHLHPLNLPRPVRVACGGSGIPEAIYLESGQVTVAAVVDTWLIDEEWWRIRIRRRYHRLVLIDGRMITLFEDREAGAWYTQEY